MKEAERTLNNKGYFIMNQFDGFYGTVTNEYELYKGDISPLNYQLVNAVQSIQNDLKQILNHWQNTSESASIEDYTLNKKYPLR